MNFVENMISLHRLLSSYDPFEATTYQTLNEKAQDPTYFIPTYLDTKDIDLAFWVFKVVKLLTRHVLLSDRFFDAVQDSLGIAWGSLLMEPNQANLIR